MTPSFQELKEEIIAAPYLFAKEKEIDLKVFISTVLEELYCPRREDDEENASSISPSRNLKKPPLVHALELVQKRLRSMREQKRREEEEEEREAAFVVAEFGCYTGGTLGQIVDFLSIPKNPKNKERCEGEEFECYHPRTMIYGFDSFEGLPENWYNNRGKGWFNLGSKEISVPGAVIVKGWFEDTVPRFFQEMLSATGSVLSLIHIDSDLYSSAKIVLNELGRFLRESVHFRSNKFPLYLVFDELINYPEFENHEIKALYEFLLETDDFIMCELIGSDQRVKGGKPRFYRKNEPCDMRVLFKLLPREKQ